jgi:hypothetical protein
MFLAPRPVEALAGAGEILRVTCFLTSSEGVAQVRSQVAAAFPAAAANFVQLTRFGVRPDTKCDAVARAPAGGASPGGAVVFRGPKIVLSSLQMAFSGQEGDIRLALDRLKKAIEPLGGRMDGAFVSVYAVSPDAAGVGERVTGGQALVFEGLPSLDAALGADVVTAGGQ